MKHEHARAVRRRADHQGRAAADLRPAARSVRPSRVRWSCGRSSRTEPAPARGVLARRRDGARRLLAAAQRPLRAVERRLRASSTPSGSESARLGHVEGGRGVEHHGGARGAAALSLQHPDDGGGVLARAAAGELGGRRSRPSRARPAGRSSTPRSSPSRSSTTRVAPRGLSSSMPGSPCTTSARSWPRTRSAPAISVRAARGRRRPPPGGARPAGLVSGPRRFMIVGIASSRAHRRHVAHGGVVERREHEDDAGLLAGRAPPAPASGPGAPRAPPARPRCRSAR